MRMPCYQTLRLRYLLLLLGLSRSFSSRQEDDYFLGSEEEEEGGEEGGTLQEERVDDVPDGDEVRWSERRAEYPWNGWMGVR